MFAAAVLLPLALAAVSDVPLVRPEPEVPVVRAEPETGAESAPLERMRFGAELAVGLPSGAEVAPFIRPTRWLQLQGALAHDGAAFGLGGGLMLGALEAPFTPTLSFGAGHFFRGDMSGSLSQVAGLDLSRYPSARSFDFDHVDLQPGLLFGFPSMQFFLRGGVSWVHSTLHDFGASLQVATGDATLTAQDPTITAWIPSARAGLLFAF